MAASGGIRAGKAFVELFTDDRALVRGLARAQARLQRFGNSVQALGAKFLKLGGAMAVPLIAGAKTFASFEKQMAEVSTLLDDPEKWMRGFTKAVREMSVQFGESTETLAKGLYDIISASVPAEKALGVLAVSAKAAQAGITDTGTAADAITTVLNAYKLSADNAANVSDFLFTVVKRGKTTFGDLAPNIGKVATIASVSGVSLDELGASIATLTRNGIKTEEAMVAVAAIISGFLKPTEDGAKLANDLGFELSAAGLRAEGFVGVFKRIQSLPPDAIAKLFPNIRAIKGVLPATQDLNGFLADVDAMKGRAGATEIAFARMAKTLSFQFGRVVQAGKLILSIIGESLAEALKSIADRVIRVANAASEWVAQNKGLVVSFAKITLATIAIGTALVGVALVVKTVAGALGLLIGVVKLTLASLLVLKVGLVALVSPIGLVVAGIVGLTYALAKNTSDGRQALSNLGDGFSELKQDATAAFTGIAEALKQGNISAAVSIMWAGLRLQWLKGTSFITNVWDEMTTMLAVGFTEAMGGIELVAARIGQAIANTWYAIADAVVDAWETAVRKLVSVYNSTLAKLPGVDTITTPSKAKRSNGISEERKRRIDQAKELAQIETRTAQRVAAIEQDKNRSAVERAEEIQKARAEFDAAVAAARSPVASETTGAPAQIAATVAAPVESMVDRLGKSLAVMISATAAKVESFDVVGTFSSVAIAQLGIGTSAADRTAEASEQTAKNTAKIAALAEDAGLEF